MDTPLSNGVALHALLALATGGALCAVQSGWRLAAEDFAAWRWRRLEQFGLSVRE